VKGLNHPESQEMGLLFAESVIKKGGAFDYKVILNESGLPLLQYRGDAVTVVAAFVINRYQVDFSG
jgi:hypothetical protein